MDIQKLINKFDRNTKEFNNVSVDTISHIEIEEDESNIQIFSATSNIDNKIDFKYQKIVNPDEQLSIFSDDDIKFDKFKLNTIGKEDSTVKFHNKVYFKELIPYKIIGDKRDTNIALNATLTADTPNGESTDSNGINAVIDNQSNTFWNPIYSETESCKAIFEFDNPLNVEYVEITGFSDDNGFSPYDWKISGSNNNQDWEDVHVVSWELNAKKRNDWEVRTLDASNKIPTIVKLDTTNAYKFYRIEFINNSSTSNIISINEIKLFEKSEIYRKYYKITDVDETELKFKFKNCDIANLYTSKKRNYDLLYSIDNINYNKMDVISESAEFKSINENLINPATFTILDSSFENNIANNLFDNLNTTYVSWNDSSDYIELDIKETFRIWTKTTLPIEDSKLKIFRKEVDGDWMQIQAGIENKHRKSDTWELSTIELPGGIYKFYVDNELSSAGFKNQRTDTQWFIEKKIFKVIFDYVKTDTNQLFFKSLSTNFVVDYFNYKKPEIIKYLPNINVVENPEDYKMKLNFSNKILLAVPFEKDFSFYLNNSSAHIWSITGTTFVNDNKFGKCLKFNKGSQSSHYFKLYANRHTSFDNWTISFWIKRDAGYRKHQNNVLLEMFNNDRQIFSSTLFYPMIFRSDRIHHFGLRDELLNKPDQWLHIMFTAQKHIEPDGENYLIISQYIDGKYIFSHRFPFKEFSCAGLNIYFGGNPTSDSAFVNGYIRDFIFYRREFIEPEDIKKLINNRLSFIKQPAKKLSVNKIDKDTGEIYYNVEKSNAKYFEVEYDEKSVSKLDFNLLTFGSELLDSKKYTHNEKSIHYYNDKVFNAFEIELEKHLIDLENLEILSADTIKSTTDISRIIIVDYKIKKILTKEENNGIFTYTFDNRGFLPQSLKAINEDYIVKHISEDNEIELNNWNEQIKRIFNNKSFKYKVKKADNGLWAGFTSAFDIKLSDIADYQNVSETKFISSDENLLNTIVVNERNDSFKVIENKPLGSKFLYIVEPYKTLNNSADINGLIIRDETENINYTGWEDSSYIRINDKIIHFLESHQSKTINFKIPESVTSIEISFRYYSFDNWDDNLNDYGFLNINGKQKWMSKRNGEIDFTGKMNKRFKTEILRVNSDWNTFSCNKKIGYFTDYYKWHGWYHATQRNRRIYYNINLYKDITILLSEEDVKKLNGNLTIDIGIHHHANRTVGSGGFSNFKVVATKKSDASDLKKLPHNKYKVVNHKNETVELTLDDIDKITFNYPFATIFYKPVDLISSYFDINVEPETLETFKQINLKTLSRNLQKPKSCLEILKLGQSVGNGVYTIYPSKDQPIPVYCDMTSEGGGWTLVGKGREGWTWDNYLQGTYGDIAHNPYSYGVSKMDSATIDKIIEKPFNKLEDGLKLFRPDLNQTIFWKFINPKKFTWKFDQGYKVDVIYNGKKLYFKDQNLYNNHLTTKDQFLNGTHHNDCSRIFTFCYEGHNYVNGFSAGRDCSAQNKWLYDNERYPIYRTLVWVRK